MQSLNRIKPIWFFVFSLILALPAFFINLGVEPFIDDEGIRSLVAYEMELSGDYVTPTMSGALYFKKPPLYNWIISAFFNMSGQHNEFWMRVPAILSLLLFTVTIFAFVRKELGDKTGVIVALMFLTCGRIIIYESLHGLIDISFSWVVYVIFMLIYRLFHQQKLLGMFVAIYLLASIAYLMKGLPIVVFMGVTLFVFFIMKKQFKMLYNWRHFLGIGLFILVVGGYYFIYFTRNNILFEELFTVLYTETTRRTVVQFGIWKTILHLFSFPFEQVFHFLPWSLFVVFLFRTDFYKVIVKNEFVKYNALIFIFNIVVYWTSPQVYPRYILMLMPLAFTVFYYFYSYRTKHQEFLNKILIGNLFPLIIVVFLMGFILSPFIFSEVLSRSYFFLKMTGIVVSVGLLFYAYQKYKPIRIPLFIVFILVFRISFSWFILPHRYEHSSMVTKKKEAQEIGKQFVGKNLYTYWPKNEAPDDYYGKMIFQHRYLYYMTTAYGNIIQQTSSVEQDAVYLVWEEHMDRNLFHVVDSIQPYNREYKVYVANVN